MVGWPKREICKERNYYNRRCRVNNSKNTVVIITKWYQIKSDYNPLEKKLAYEKVCPEL